MIDGEGIGAAFNCSRPLQRSPPTTAPSAGRHPYSVPAHPTTASRHDITATSVGATACASTAAGSTTGSQRSSYCRARAVKPPSAVVPGGCRLRMLAGGPGCVSNGAWALPDASCCHQHAGPLVTLPTRRTHLLLVANTTAANTAHCYTATAGSHPKSGPSSAGQGCAVSAEAMGVGK